METPYTTLVYLAMYVLCVARLYTNNKAMRSDIEIRNTDVASRLKGVVSTLCIYARA
jgi:hypothetical protein